ncbi:fibrobacter succinogenes major paralogous domain-containing protein [uncultured Fibrobacter sp.]|uniref:fibrobacter succinogenes major paralogous domain-containing protein n=1 Tax=uncultured Fibrobacter sp. TaxID=261512 RepID=UPI0025EBAE4B|nr:fibrobacter succinogenes major paralogous domain-containing protein [uncultured Fibrobacter sp.]
MRSLWLGVLVCAAMFVACGDDDSDFATRPSDGSSSSVTPKSSDGETSVSSSSTKSSSSSEYTRVPCDAETDENCFEDARDGQTYKTVKIGDQVWMAENLNFEMDSSFCYIKEESNCAKYGRLYRWAAAVGKSESECGYGYTCSLPSGNIQGVCPKGWHLPSKAEWKTLFNAVGGKSTAGKILKSTSGWNSSGNGTDSFGFSALPAGGRLSDGGYYGKGNHADFWSSTESDDDDAYDVYLYYGIDDAYLSFGSKDHWVSVRCVKDDP